MTEETIRTAGRVAFLERLEEIRKDLAKGWSVRAVYNTHKDHVKLSERQFRKYVARYITEAAPQQPTPTVSSPAPVEQPAAKTTSPGPASLPPPPEPPKVGRLDPDRARALTTGKKDDVQ